MAKFLLITLLTLLLTPLTQAWLPTKDKGVIRGVNLGGLFIIEPWMQSQEWSNMGCGAYKSEFDCVMNIGQAKADAAFKKHWQTWITEADFKEMVSYGINTVRIPVGYWMLEDLVYRDSEYFPKGGYPHLVRICGLAKKYGLYVILDLHGAPGAQIKHNAFTGQDAPSAGFYVSYQYNRAVTFLGWITKKIHTDPNFSTVGMLQVLNEPLAWEQDQTASMITEYYPKAWNKIRSVEKSLKVTGNKRLHVMFMDENWGSGNPNQNLPSTDFASYDYHKYVKWDTSVKATRESYMQYSCSSSLGVQGQKPLIVGEWSLSVPDSLQESTMFKTSSGDAIQWFQHWFIAQQQMYERSGLGWVFWNWKTTLDDWRWSYRDAVRAGVIPKKLYRCVKWDVCRPYKKKRDELVKDAVVVPAVENMKREAVIEAEAVVGGKAPVPSGEVEVRSTHAGKHRTLRRRHGHVVRLSP
ncbi:hypothetical protein ABW19_dt0205352 [Dactylella cylindrospora]|nr:hypothetical protein ABW19_dt0205352 [Dactylella cylindrospora]